MAGLDNRYVLHGEEEYEYFAPVLAGDVLTCKARISDAYEKAGKRGGKMTFVVFEYTYFNQRGEKALVSRSTLIQTGGVVKEDRNQESGIGTIRTRFRLKTQDLAQSSGF